MSIWPSIVTTEMMISFISQFPEDHEVHKLLETAETPQFTGLVIEALYGDPDIMTKSGQTIIGAEAAIEYGFTDINGYQPPSMRQTVGSPRSYDSDMQFVAWESPL